MGRSNRAFRKNRFFEWESWRIAGIFVLNTPEFRGRRKGSREQLEVAGMVEIDV